MSLFYEMNNVEFALAIDCICTGRLKNEETQLSGSFWVHCPSCLGEFIPEVLPRSSGTNVFILFCVSVCSFSRRHALYFFLIFWAPHCFQKIVYFAFMYVCIHWLMDGWTYWLCGCVWIQATLGTQRTACKSHFSPSTMWASGVKLRLLGWVVWTLTHSFIVFAFFYCFMFHLGESFLSLSFWQKWYIPLKKILFCFSSQSIRPQPLALPVFLCAHLPKYVWSN